MMGRDTTPAVEITAFTPRLRRLPRRGVDWNAGFWARRLLIALVGVWGSVSLVFFLMLATGSPAVLMAGGQASAADVAAINALHGFDRSLLAQYFHFLGNVLRGEFPLSLRYQTSSFAVIGAALPYSLALIAAGAVFGAGLGLVVGYVSVQARQRWLREIPLALLGLAQATPVFVTGLLAILLFSLTLGWLPTGGSGSTRHLVLPALTLGLLIAPPTARLFRASLLQQQRAEHVRTALAKAIPLRQVQWRHEALNSLAPVITLLGMQIGAMLGGTVLTESVFGWPGVGTVLVSAVGMKDYPVVLAAVLLIALMVALFNLLADVLVLRVDPRAGVSR